MTTNAAMMIDVATITDVEISGTAERNNESQLIENIFIPLKIIKRGGYKGQFLSQTLSAEKPEPNETLVRALLKAYLWEKIIYEQFGGNLDLFCQQNKFSKRYAQKILKLNLLSPKIKEAIMDGTQPKNLLLEDIVKKPIAVDWREQETTIGCI